MSIPFTWPCPQDPKHGRLLPMADGRQYCPHRQHQGEPFYTNGQLERLAEKR